MQKISSRKLQWVFLWAISISGIGLAWLATFRYGAGLAGDSIHYLSVAENILHGRGFVDFAGQPLIWFPPLLPLLLAGLAWLLRQDVFLIGWVMNLLLWGLNLFLSGLIFMRLFRRHPAYFYLSSLVVLTSTAYLTIHNSILTDPLFLSFTLLFFLAGEAYLLRRGWGALLVLLVIAILSPLLRFSGFTQVVSGFILVLVAWRQRPMKGILLAGGFGVLTLLPIALWIYLHNYLPYGTWWGTDNSAGANVVVNILQSLRKMMYWFIPYRQFSQNGFVEPVAALVLMLAVLVLINHKNHWREWLKACLRPEMLSMLVLSLVYYSSSVLNIQTMDHRSLSSDRYFIVLLVPVLGLSFTSFEHLIRPHIHLPAQRLRAWMLVFFALWLCFPLYKDYKYISASIREGEAGYNNYNLPRYHNSAVLAHIRSLLLEKPQARLYSNIAPVVWFYTRHETLFPPAQDRPRTKDEIKTDFAGWPGDKPGVYIWFEPDPFELFLPLKDLGLVADLRELENLPDGRILYVFSR